MAYSMRELYAEFAYHVNRITDALPVTAAASAVPVIFTEHLLGDWYILEMWFVMNVLDLVGGVSLALVSINPKTGKSCFSRRKLYGWALKMVTHFGCIILAGCCTILIYRLTDNVIPLTDWAVAILLLTEMTSVLDTATKLGLPVPPIAQKIVAFVRRKIEKNFDEEED